MLNALASALTQEMVGRIVPIASEKFFEAGNQATLYYKERVGEIISTNYRKELASRPNTFTKATVKRVLVNAPAFLTKTGQRLTFSSRITYEVEATKTTWRHPPAVGGSGLFANIAPSGVSVTGPGGGVAPPTGLLSGLFNTAGSTGPTGSAAVSGPIGPMNPLDRAVFGALSGPTGPTGVWDTAPHLANPAPPPLVQEEIRRAGRHVFEVIWSATLTPGGSVTNLKLVRIDFKQSVWEEEP
jgi:hypothetical protein